jgi:hypothetical protein
MCKSKFYCLWLSAFLTSAVCVGCNNAASVPKENQSEAKASVTDDDKDAKVTAALAKLSEEDRLAAQAQKFCVVEQEHRLGEMGVPIRLIIEGQPVFLCCEDCKDEALKDPTATLAKVAELKRKNSTAENK